MQTLFKVNAIEENHENVSVIDTYQKQFVCSRLSDLWKDYLHMPLVYLIFSSPAQIHSIFRNQVNQVTRKMIKDPYNLERLEQT